MSHGFLEQFAEWATNDRLICPSKAIEEARLAYIDTIACILAGQNQPISTKIQQFSQSLHTESSVMGTASDEIGLGIEPDWDFLGNPVFEYKNIT